MSRHYVFADEAGCFTFERKPNVSKYFMLCTITTSTCDVGADLMVLRKDMAWNKEPLLDCFHACEDKQQIRDAVFERILNHEFSIQATIMEKSKAQHQLRASKARFYQYGWFYHFKYGVSQSLPYGKDALVTAASIGSRKEKLSFTNVIDDVMAQTVKAKWAVDFVPSGADPCLQVADYCAWAIQRKWERGDDRSYNLIKDRIKYEYDLFAKGTTHYY